MDLHALVNEGEHTPGKAAFDGPFPPSPPLTAPDSRSASVNGGELEGAQKQEETSNGVETAAISSLEGAPSTEPSAAGTSMAEAPAATQTSAEMQPQFKQAPATENQFTTISNSNNMDVDTPSLPPGLAPHTSQPPPFSRQGSASSMAVAPPASPLNLASANPTAPPVELQNLPTSTSTKRLASDDLEQEQAANKRLRQTESPMQPDSAVSEPSQQGSSNVMQARSSQAAPPEQTQPSQVAHQQQERFQSTEANPPTQQTTDGQPPTDSVESVPVTSLATNSESAALPPVVTEAPEQSNIAAKSQPQITEHQTQQQSTPDQSQNAPPIQPAEENAPVAPAPALPLVPTPMPPPPVIQRSPIQIPNNQLKYCTTMLRQLKKAKEAPPFMAPVDPVYLGIPLYYAIITDPMDLGTVEKKLLGGAYSSAANFLEDIRKIFRNCYRFNGEQAPVSLMAKSLEATFNKLANKMPAESKPVSLPAPFPGYPPANSPLASSYSSHKGKKSMSQSHGRRDSMSLDRPKREIHAPPTYDELEDQLALPKKRKSASALSEDMKFCREVLRELTKKANYAYVWPFLEPVDWVTMNLLDYPKIIKRPMDLGTMRQKLEEGEYNSSTEFLRDFKLIVKNCKTYNKAESDVARMGSQLDFMFDRKWAEKPESSDEDEGADDQIDMMEHQLNLMRANLREMKDNKSRRKFEKKMLADSLKASKGPRPSNGSGSMKKHRQDSLGGSMSAPRKKKRRGSSDEDEPLVEVSYEMKRDLANGIASFEGDKLERAIDIIRKSRPDLLGDESKEIELDIDQLDERTLLKLYNFVVLGDRKKSRRSETLTAAGTKAQKGGRAGTGGLKGKSLDEDEESAKIRALEAKLQAFEGVAGVQSTIDPESSSAASEGESESESE